MASLCATFGFPSGATFFMAWSLDCFTFSELTCLTVTFEGIFAGTNATLSPTIATGPVGAGAFAA